MLYRGWKGEVAFEESPELLMALFVVLRRWSSSVKEVAVTTS